MTKLNTERILELLGTTSPDKMRQLHRMEAEPAMSSEMTANEMLNADLFGTPNRGVRRASASETMHTSNASRRAAARESAMSHVDRRAAARESAINHWSRKDADECCDGKKGAKECSQAPASECGSAKSRLNFKRKSADEQLITATDDSAFPENFEFDEVAFTDEYGIDVSTFNAMYVPTDPESEIPEHVEVSFDYDGSHVVLSIAGDNVVTETVDGEVVDAQFSATFSQIEDEKGEKKDIMALDLIEDTEDKGEGEDDVVMSEGDMEHTDEDGAGPTDEFIEEKGLELDPHYATQHKMPIAEVSKTPQAMATVSNETVIRAKGPGRPIAKESLADMPAALKKYYKTISKEAFAEASGDSVNDVVDAKEIANIAPGFKFLGYLKATPDYEDAMGNNGEDLAFLVANKAGAVGAYTTVGGKLVPINVSKYGATSGAKESLASRVIRTSK